MEEAAPERKRVDVLSRQELSSLDAYWRAANYLSVGQIYLLDNPLLQEPLKPEHIKPGIVPAAVELGKEALPTLSR